MTTRYLTSIALATGVAAGWVVNWVVLEVMPKLTEGAIRGPMSAPWVATLFSFAFVVSLMVPGFVAGLVAGRRGILIGASAAIILAMLAVLPELLFVLRTPEWSLGEAAGTLVSILMRYPASIVASAVAGGCAEHLRSNKSLERTRER
jgi:MFS family permease